MSDADLDGAEAPGEPVLVLVKHAMPVLVPSLPARRWVLGEDGRRQAHALAERLARFRPAVVVGSAEPKARETAEIVAADWGCMAQIAPGLHEHERETVGWLGADKLTSAVERFFANPDAVVFGEESASAARRRFAAAVDRLLAEHPDQHLIVVAHGTVISLFAGERSGVDPFALWQRLTCPSFVVLSRASFRVLEVVERSD
ncbi:MAG: histidine phosphatase family protein [Thermomicrobiales bacterium]